MRQALGHVAQWSARNRVGVLAVLALLMGGLALGIPSIRFEDDPLGAMPIGDPHTLAAENVTRSFPGAAYASPVFVGIDPAKWSEANANLPNRVRLDDPRIFPAGAPNGNHAIRALNDLLASLGQQPVPEPLPQPGAAPPQMPDGVPGPYNITDEVYMRGMHELFGFLQQRIPEMRWAITLESQVRLVNYTNTGIPRVQKPDPDAFAMPGTGPEGEFQFASAWTTYFVASPNSVRSVVSADWSSTRLAYLFEPGDKTIVDIGGALYRAVDEYRDEVARCDGGERCALTWNVFEHESIIVDPRAPTTASSYLTRVTLEDVYILTPIAVLVVGVFLFSAFRRPSIVAAMVIPLAVAGFGVLGVFGLFQIPIQSVSLLVFPVLVGTGIDFGIHMASAYHDARNRGKDALAAAFESGQSAGVPLFVVTVTTLVGMGFLIFAPNLLLRDLGIAIVLGLSILLVVSITALPAALSFTKPAPMRRTFMDRALVRSAAFFGRFRWVAVGSVLAVVAVSLVAAPMLKTLVIGTPAAFYPDGDRQREDFEASNERYFRGSEDLVTNVLVLEGDLTRPEAQDFLSDLESEMKELPFVRDESVVSIHFAINAWIQVREGTAGAPLVLAQEAAQPGSTFPQDQAGIRALLDEMFATPLANYADFFIEPGSYEIGVFLLEITQPPEFSDLAAEWDAIQAKLSSVQAQHPDSGLRVHMSGASAVAYLFTARELPYLQIAAYLGIAVTAAQVLILRRSVRDALVVSAVVLAAGAWWLGLLVAWDIPLSIALVVPLVILEAIGSDYALHLRFAIAKQGAEAWGHVGRAVWYSAVTDIAAFLVFTRLRYGLLRDATIATVFVLACALIATLILVPALSRKRELPTPEPMNAPSHAASA